jgi:phosphoribosylglycinamide formyltransferase 1
MSHHAPLRLVVLISGRGSNLQALIAAIQNGTVNANIVAVISNRPEALGLELAQAHHIHAQAIDHLAFNSRQAFDSALAECIQSHTPDLIVLAGFMRVLSPDFVSLFTPRLINIHPSLLPSFPGLHTHQRAIEEGVKFHGCTVHAVTPELDRGHILGQAIVPVLPEDTIDQLAERVLQAEHQLLPQTIQAIADGYWQIKNQAWTLQKSHLMHPHHFSSALRIG